jgi:hypothetical protein
MIDVTCSRKMPALLHTHKIKVHASSLTVSGWIYAMLILQTFPILLEAMLVYIQPQTSRATVASEAQPSRWMVCTTRPQLLDSGPAAQD